MSPAGGPDRWLVPIAVGPAHYSGNVFVHVYMGGPAASSFGRAETEANAEFIVRAANAHDDLLAACEAATKRLKALKTISPTPGTPMQLQAVAWLDEAIDACESAIAKAKGGAA